MPTIPDNEEKLTAVKEDLLKKRIATVAAATREHVVTDKQLQNRYKGIGILSSRPINEKNLSDGQQEGLCLYVQKIDNICFPIIPEAVEASTNTNLVLYYNYPDKEHWVLGASWV